MGNKYTITFNANGGDVESESIKQDYNTKITLPRAIKVGYKFKGWYSDSECTDANKVGDAEDNYTIKTNVMLYAKWGKNEHTTEDGNKITFETDGGEESLGEIEETEDGAIILPRPTKEGYTFVGWYEDEAYTKWAGDAGDEYKPEGDTTIYAKWKANQYTVTFNANGGNTDTEKIKQDYDTSITLPEATKVGFKFKGWYSDINGKETNKVGNAGDSYIIKGEATLYAKWGKNEYITEEGNKITFETDGGEESLGEIEETEDGAIILPEPTKEGYTFKGWYSDSTHINFVGNAGDKYKPDGRVFLYAKWSINKSSITINPNGGSIEVTPSGETAENISTSTKYTEKYNTTLAIANPTKANSTNTSEYTVTYNYNYTGTTNTSDTATNTIVKSYTFVGWEKSDKFYGTFLENTYTFGPENNVTSTITANYESKEVSNTTTSVILPNPTRAGYTFAGWYKDEACTEAKRVGNAEESYTPTGNITLYAKWNTSQYTLTLNANGGSVTPTTIVKNYNEAITLPTAIRTGHTVSFNTNGGSAVANKTSTYAFNGWYTEATGGTKKEYTKMPAGNETLYAHWTHNGITLPAAPTKTGYTFGGWYSDSACTEVNKVTGTTYTPTGNITLYAKWEPSIYAKLYSDGTLVFTNINRTLLEKTSAGITVEKEYELKNETQPWVNERVDIKKVDIVDAIYPTSTANWFNGCTSLERIDNISNLSTSNVTNMRYMFYRCRILSSLDVSNFDTRNVTDMHAMFAECSSLTSLNLSNFVTSKVTDMEGMFNFCSKLTSLNLSNFNTSQVTTMSWMFGHCSSLTSLNISSFDTSRVTKIDNIFIENSNLVQISFGANWNKTVTLPTISKTNYSFGGWYSESTYTNKVVTDNGASYTPTRAITLYAKWDINKYKLTLNANGGSVTPTSIEANYNAAITLPTATRTGYTVGFNTNGGSAIANKTSTYTFGGWYTEVTGGTKKEYTKMPAGNETLYAHWTHNGITLPTAPTKTGYTFAGWYSDSACTEAKKITGTTYTPTENITLYAKWNKLGIFVKLYSDGELVFTKTDRVLETKENAGITVTSNYGDINRQEFDYNTLPWAKKKTSIESVDIVDKIQPTSTAYWFYECRNLITINNIANLDTSKVTDMMDMFGYCSKLTSLNLSSFNTSNVTNMGQMFHNCSSLTSLNVANFNTSKVTNIFGIFEGCSSLTSLDLSSFNTSNVTDMTQMFWGCSSLTSLDLSSFNTSKVTSMHGMFNGCSSLTSLDLSSFNTSNVTDMYYMFCGCSNLTSLDLSNFKTNNVTNMNSMFATCGNLTTIYVTSSNWITTNADTEDMFYNCGTSSVTRI